MHFSICNKVLKESGCFNFKAYDNNFEELTKTMNMKIEKSHVKSWWKILKEHFSDGYDILKNDMSGFTIDQIKQVWMAKLEVWNVFIKVKLNYG